MDVNFVPLADVEVSNVRSVELVIQTEKSPMIETGNELVFGCMKINYFEQWRKL